eukprot:scaffold95460_cov32-Tisochrysis_lutea.AAC.3
MVKESSSGSQLVNLRCGSRSTSGSCFRDCDLATTRISSVRGASTSARRQQIKLAAALVGAHTRMWNLLMSLEALETPASVVGCRKRAHCRMASTSVVVFPVPGGPKSTYGTLRAGARTIAATACRCS